MCADKGVGTRYLYFSEARVISCDRLQSRELLLSEEIEITSSSLNPGELISYTLKGKLNKTAGNI
jgi:hypothetical protein